MNGIKEALVVYEERLRSIERRAREIGWEAEFTGRGVTLREPARLPRWFKSPALASAFLHGVMYGKGIVDTPASLGNIDCANMRTV